MFEKSLFRFVAVLAALMLLIGTAQADVIIETVPVGYPGNAPDDNGYGTVDELYLIGKYEVTAGQYTEFLNAVADTDSYGLYNTNMTSYYGCKIARSGSSGSYSYTVAPDRENRPVNYVSWGDAARFANWLHNGQPTGAQGNGTTEDGAYVLNGAMSQSTLMAIMRQSDATWFLPTENEWYKAAYHKNDGIAGNYFDYPTASDAVPSNGLIDPDPGNNANFFQNGYTIGGPYWTTEVGEFENSASPYGTFDQGGNLWEWNESVYTAGLSRGLRGGDWYYDSAYPRATFRSNNNPPYENAYIGFRVASVPEPGSIALLVFGLITGLVWWRCKR
ncbi:MAG TPA: SUMF1/EgtB/PvdO family nonheme iron enzyme [Thermoguttaceae bacterium]|nr:SUMF1/EgtB/PvdO family nonheme iron enzyme [Thermoguttaceae bacterium]